MVKAPSRLHVAFTVEERAKVDAVAEMHDLDTSTFVRLVLAGAIAQGGGTLTALLTRGQATVPIKKSRLGRNYENEWTFNPDTKEWSWGPWRLHKDEKYRQFNTRAHVSREPKSWWHLYHVDDPSVRVPIAFERVEAVTKAVQMIESKGGINNGQV